MAAHIVRDSIDAGQNIRFQWTVNDNVFAGAWSYKFICTGIANESEGGTIGTLDWNNRDGRTDAGKACSFKFIAPETATDWRQRIIDADGSSEVFSGNIEKESPWAFHELTLLPETLTRIPDLAPIAGDPDATIYAAVNLALYMTANLLGFLNGSWMEGQTLSELGVNIVNGEVAGLQGIYWATTPFEFNPDPTGRGFTPLGGDMNLLNSATFGHEIVLLQQHTTGVPEPSSLVLLGVG